MSILICIISGLFWAAFDLTRKLSLKVISPKSILILFSIIQVILFLFWIFLGTFHLNIIPYLYEGTLLIVISVFSAIFFLEAIKKSELSLTIPLLSFTPLFSTIFSGIFLNENLNSLQHLGIFSIIFGTLILYSKNFKIKSLFASILEIKNNHSARLMLIVALSWSITPVLDKLCLEHSSINIHGFLQALGILFFLLVFSPKEIKELKKLKKKKIYLVGLTVLVGSIATVLQFYAILTNFVPIMESIKRTIGQFLSVFFGRLYFNETISKQKVVGVFFLSLGIFFII